VFGNSVKASKRDRFQNFEHS